MRKRVEPQTVTVVRFLGYRVVPLCPYPSFLCSRTILRYNNANFPRDGAAGGVGWSLTPAIMYQFLCRMASSNTVRSESSFLFLVVLCVTISVNLMSRRPIVFVGEGGPSARALFLLFRRSDARFLSPNLRNAPYFEPMDVVVLMLAKA